jgi:pimeloyl-ACP methyl ester carboxylesterase
VPDRTADPEPLVLLPGMNCSARLWQPVAALLGDLVEVRPVELSGSSVDECVRRLLAQLPARFAVVGLSLGGVVAMALTRQASERVARLGLVATNPRAPTEIQLRSWAETRAALRSGTSAREVQTALLPELLSLEARSGPLTAEVLQMADEVGTERLQEQLAMQASRIDEGPGLAHVRVPTLVLAGGADTMVPPDWAEEVRASVPTAEVVVLPGVGHLSPLEAPEAVAGLLRDWLGPGASKESPRTRGITPCRG